MTSPLLAQEDDLRRMRGDWEVVELVEDGKVIPRQAIPDWLPSGGRIQIEDNAIVIHSITDQKRHVRVFSIDATKYPRSIKITDAHKQETEGIYKFDENKLVVCLSDTGDKAPTEFSAKEGSGRALLVMQPAKGAAPTATAKPKPAPEKPKPEETPAATVLTDAEVSKLLQGAWKYDDSVGALYVMFRSNGTFSTTREYQELRLFQRVFVQTPVTSGTWKVERGTLKFHVTTSIYADRVGNTFGFAVRSISDKDMIFIDYLGHVGRAKKMVAQAAETP
jgi:uncharacterized protein (TIGR03067 family)